MKTPTLCPLCLVTDIFLLLGDVLLMCATLGDHLEESSTRVFIFLMLLQMLSQLINLLSQK